MLLKSFVSAVASFLVVGGVLNWISGFWFLAKSQSIICSWSVLSNNPFSFKFFILVDAVSLMFSGSVALVAGAVFMFSISYMSQEKFFLRFHLLVVTFVGSMMALIFSPNLISLLLGWDGLGVTSFLLVVYFQSAKSFNAGMITVLSNRVGDILILLAIATYASCGYWDLFWGSQSSQLVSEMGAFLSLVVVATFTKSAQVPFSAWLPAAMAAPTPVSSLVHSSTLVTAGVYLLLRLNDWLVSSGVWAGVAVMGISTMFMAGVSAMFETDMKKIVALSTLSQLGLMMTSLSLGAWEATLCHLLTHAYFKALLFMVIGNSIHLSDDFQDMRKASLSPFSSMSLAFVWVANLSLCGFPFMAGFYSKDWIVELGGQISLSTLVPTMLLLGVLLTASYSFRLMSLLNWSSQRANPLVWEKDDDGLVVSGCWVLTPLAILGGTSLVLALSSCEILLIEQLLKSLPLILILSGIVLYLAPFFKSSKSGFSNYSYFWGSMWALPFFSSPIPTNALSSSSKMGRFSDLSWSSEAPISLGGGSGYWASYEISNISSMSFLNLTSGLIWLGVLIFIYWVECLLGNSKS